MARCQCSKRARARLQAVHNQVVDLLAEALIAKKQRCGGDARASPTCGAHAEPPRAAPPAASAGLPPPSASAGLLPPGTPMACERHAVSVCILHDWQWLCNLGGRTHVRRPRCAPVAELQRLLHQACRAVVRGVQHLAGLPSRLPCGVPLHETRKEVGLPCCAGELGHSASMPVRRFIVRLPAAAAPAAPAAKGGADDGDATVRMRHTPRERASCSGVCWGR